MAGYMWPHRSARAVSIRSETMYCLSWVGLGCFVFVLQRLVIIGAIHACFTVYSYSSADTVPLECDSFPVVGDSPSISSSKTRYDFKH